MSDKKTLKLRDPSEQDAQPRIKKKGRGWEISESRLDSLHARAREMRRESTPAHKVLAERFAKADLKRYVFKRHAVIGSAIVDFACHNLGMAIAIDEDGVDPAIATRRDRSLEAVRTSWASWATGCSTPCAPLPPRTRRTCGWPTSPAVPSRVPRSC